MDSTKSSLDVDGMGRIFDEMNGWLETMGGMSEKWIQCGLDLHLVSSIFSGLD